MYVERGTTSVIAKMQKKILKVRLKRFLFLTICCLYLATIPLNALSESLYNPNAFLCIFSFPKKTVSSVFCATFFAIYSKKNVISTQRFLLEWNDMTRWNIKTRRSWEKIFWRRTRKNIITFLKQKTGC